jgi:hypothetical protein
MQDQACPILARVSSRMRPATDRTMSFAVDNRRPYSRQQHAGLDGWASWRSGCALTMAPRNLVTNSAYGKSRADDPAAGLLCESPGSAYSRSRTRELASTPSTHETNLSIMGLGSNGYPLNRQSSGFSGWIEYARPQACLPELATSNLITEWGGGRSSRSIAKELS